MVNTKIIIIFACENIMVKSILLPYYLRVNNSDSKSYIVLKDSKMSKQYCPNCGTENPVDVKYCSKCGTALNQGTTRSTNSSVKKEVRQLRRSSSDKMIAGVCGGIGEYLGISGTVLRIAYAIAFLIGSLGLWIYIVCWIIMKKE